MKQYLLRLDNNHHHILSTETEYKRNDRYENRGTIVQVGIKMIEGCHFCDIVSVDSFVPSDLVEHADLY